MVFSTPDGNTKLNFRRTRTASMIRTDKYLQLSLGGGVAEAVPPEDKAAAVGHSPTRPTPTPPSTAQPQPQRAVKQSPSRTVVSRLDAHEPERWFTDNESEHEAMSTELPQIQGVPKVEGMTRDEEVSAKHAQGTDTSVETDAKTPRVPEESLANRIRRHHAETFTSPTVDEDEEHSSAVSSSPSSSSRPSPTQSPRRFPPSSSGRPHRQTSRSSSPRRHRSSSRSVSPRRKEGQTRQRKRRHFRRFVGAGEDEDIEEKNHLARHVEEMFELFKTIPETDSADKERSIDDESLEQSTSHGGQHGRFKPPSSWGMHDKLLHELGKQVSTSAQKYGFQTQSLQVINDRGEGGEVSHVG